MNHRALLNYSCQVSRRLFALRQTAFSSTQSLQFSLPCTQLTSRTCRSISLSHINLSQPKPKPQPSNTLTPDKLMTHAKKVLAIEDESRPVLVIVDAYNVLIRQFYGYKNRTVSLVTQDGNQVR
jgi:hypothetical protein